MEYVQLSSELCVPVRTAELAWRHPGVMALLESGVHVRHYLDAREERVMEYFRDVEVMRHLLFREVEEIDEGSIPEEAHDLAEALLDNMNSEPTSPEQLVVDLYLLDGKATLGCEKPKVSSRISTLRAIIDTEFFWGIGVGDPNRTMYSKQMEP